MKNKFLNWLSLVCLNGLLFLTPAAANTLSDSSDTQSNVSSGGSSLSIPSGMIAFFMAGSCPDEWVLANGQNGSPDLRGMFIRANDAGRGVDPGRSVGSYQKDMLANHQHANPGFRLYNDGCNSAGCGDGPDTPRDASNSQYSGAIYAPSTNAGIGSEVRVKNISLLACYKS